MSAGTSTGTAGADVQVSEFTNRRGGGGAGTSAMINPAAHLSDPTTSRPQTHPGIFALVHARQAADPTNRQNAR